MSNWIDVNEKLPDNYTDVLIINKARFQHVVHYVAPKTHKLVSKSGFLYKPNRGLESRSFHDHREPTHWMPLPKPPNND